jgi:uncharacterized protein YecT (DUF1311 family)
MTGARSVACLVLATSGFGWPAVATAAPDPVEARLTPAYNRCLASPDGQSTMGMIDCVGAELKIQDARLNAAYRKAMSGLNARQHDKLQAAQRAWLAFRDAECASLYDDDWGTLSRVIASDCILSMTVKRTMDLEHYPPQT